MEARIRSAGCHSHARCRRPAAVSLLAWLDRHCSTSRSGCRYGNSVATPFGFDRRGQDHPRRLVTPFRPSARAWDAPFAEPRCQQAISAVGCAPVPFCSSPPSRSAWATKGFFFFQSPSSSPEMPPPWSRINTGAVRVPPTQPKGSASGPTLRTTGSVALVRANQGPLFTSSPARFIRSRPPLRGNRTQRPVPAQWPPLGLR